ncbi:MAG: hypothetical protein ACRDD7_08710 [Peptostreptococcaceae bacterium]
MNMICTKCNYTGKPKDFKPLTMKKNESKIVDGGNVTVMYSKTDYICPKCLNMYFGEYEPNGYY